MARELEDSAQTRGRWGNPVFWVVILAVLVLVPMTYTLSTGSRLTRKYAPLVDAAMEIKLEAAIGHLWFEEIISGDRYEEIALVWEHIDRAEWYARAMLEGGENREGLFLPLSDPELRREIGNVIAKIREFRSIAERRWALAEQSGIASDVDQQFDAVFKDFLAQADRVETALQEKIALDLGRFHLVQGLLTALTLALFVLAGVVLWRYEKRKRHDRWALERSEKNLSITLDSIGDAVIATDTAGCVTRMNSVAEALTGWPADEARGRPLDEVFRIINAQTRKEVESPAAKVLREGVVVGLANHTVLVARDGTERQIADSGAPIKDDRDVVNGVVLVFRDVTDSYFKEEQLRENERLLNRVCEIAKIGGWEMDLERGGKATWTKGTYDIVEITPGEPVPGAAEHVSWYLPEYRAMIEQKMKDLIETKKPMQFEAMGRTKKGNLKWCRAMGEAVEKKGKVVKLRGLFQDITDQHRDEAERERLARVIEQASDSVVITDAEGTIQYTNPAFEQVTGFTRDEAVGQNPRILKSGEHDDAFYEEMWETLTSGEAWTGRIVNRRKDGKLFTEDATISPVRDRAGKTINYVAVKHDITEKIKLEQQYRQAQKVESIGRLAGGVAHDLNNLLSPIIGYGEMLKEELGSGERHRNFVDQILGAGFRARDLVRQLLAFSRKQTLEYKPVDMNEVVAGYEKLLRHTIREDIETTLVQSPHIPVVLADMGQIEQVLMNLVVNAADAMPEGGCLTIETAPVELDEDYGGRHPGVEPGAYVMLAVSDTGCGIDDAIREHLFEPFFSTKGSEGTGMGLATVYGIVKQHGGHIWIYSEIGKGTTFKVYLPVSEKVSVEQTADLPSIGNLEGSETILLVEDNESVRHLTQAILMRRGYTVLMAESGPEAMALLASYEDRVDLLLTDVVMPDMSGKDLFVMASGLRPALKVLYMSGYTDNVIAHRGVLDEGTAFIQKPFSVRNLAAEVRRVLDQEGGRSRDDGRESARGGQSRTR